MATGSAARASASRSPKTDPVTPHEPNPWWRAGRTAVQVVAAPLWVAMLGALWPVLHLDSLRRRTAGQLPRVVWGPCASVIHVEYAASIRPLGYRADVVAYDLDTIIDRGRIDRLFSAKRLPRLLRPLLPYLVFVFVLLKYDLFNFFFNAEGFLRDTPFRYFELPLLKVFGKRVVCQAYGSDVQRRHLAPAWYKPYLPDGVADALIARNVAHCERWSDFRIAGGDLYAYVDRTDLCTLLLAFDVESVAPCYPPREGGAPVRVVHGTHHPQLKGTAYIEQACAALKAEGLPVEYVFVHGLRNDEARRLYARADIIVDQLLLGTHGMFAVEGMGLGKPVVGHISAEVRAANPILAHCPIVEADTKTVAHRLRELVGNPERRHRLGRESRRYVERFHSYAYIGALWDAIFRHVWLGAPRPQVVPSVGEIAVP